MNKKYERADGRQQQKMEEKKLIRIVSVDTNWIEDQELPTSQPAKKYRLIAIDKNEFDVNSYVNEVCDIFVVVSVLTTD